MTSRKEELNIDKLPQHVAIIMDGNGRWAKKKGYLRAFGHENGVDALKKISEASSELGIKYLTVYAFSSENWNRPKREVNALMSLMVSSLREELQTLIKNEIKLETIGRVETLPAKCQRQLTEVMDKTGHFNKLTLTLALSYGAKEELKSSVIHIAEKVKSGELSPEDINEEMIEKNLYTKEMPSPDLLIRTGGEYRVSNYLLWQIAYSELYFTDKLWPDFGKEDFYEAIWDYQQRERRFGKISEQLNS